MNQLFFGDNLHVLREHLAKESVASIQLDPSAERDFDDLMHAPNKSTHSLTSCQ